RYKLGDVYRSYLGKTVEINNTDAEGRLLLADALSYAAKNLKPKCIVDLATLTGACVVALGVEIAGLFSNDDSIEKKWMDSSDATNELLCRLPKDEEYKEAVDAHYVDLVDSSDRGASAIKAALSLQEFVEDVPWDHIEIAGPAFFSKV